jgi:hypothetical protein
MSANPYAPPLASVEDIASTYTPDREPPFFPVSLTKLAIMSICTLSLYEIYWFYQNWRRIKQREGGSLIPVARAIFGVIFCYACFARIRDHDASAGAAKLAAGPLAAGWIILTVSWKLPDPYWWVTMLAFLFMLPVQAHANRLNAAAAPGHDENSKFRGWNWVGILVGATFLLLAAIGTLLDK